MAVRLEHSERGGESFKEHGRSPWQTGLNPARTLTCQTLGSISVPQKTTAKFFQISLNLRFSLTLFLFVRSAFCKAKESFWGNSSAVTNTKEAQSTNTQFSLVCEGVKAMFSVLPAEWNHLGSFDNSHCFVSPLGKLDLTSLGYIVREFLKDSLWFKCEAKIKNNLQGKLESSKF